MYFIDAGLKRQWSDDNGQEGEHFNQTVDDGFTSTLSERVKRRKRVITYKEDGQSDDETSERANNTFETPSRKGTISWEPDAKLRKTPTDVDDVEIDDPVIAG